jgi:hypothetical protein
MQLYLLAQLPLKADAIAVAHRQHPDHELGIDRRSANVAVERRELLTRSMADRCGEIAALLEASSASQRLRPRRSAGAGGLEDRVLRIASGAPLTRRDIRFAGMFALSWFAMDAFWFISTLNHWFGL